MALAALRQHWQKFRQGEPGKRFQDYYERRHGEGSAFLSGCRLVLGLVLLPVGLVMMPAPGPGMIVVALAAVMVARESRTAARLFDATELRLRDLLRRIRG
ncbi:PGPGW domain-containing protein [Solimonas sp. SE-A11]|uniref:PGPGW domain-containing protein n=1 Tax=Solimonas sp. SE-A11 TaxID=3054954 RepID=UPI00259C9E22|nr:PGPGW domain-containing protein [Solimonas sp. SE-A11]MDM4768885.1 PGPGW domain-containing protein [Solimonas sp. SE-A11]